MIPYHDIVFGDRKNG